MTTGVPLKFSNSTRLYINESSKEPSCHNQTMTNGHNMLHWRIGLIISGLLNGLLLFLLIGLLKVFVFGKSIKEPGQRNTEENQEGDELQYATVDFSKVRKKSRSSQDKSTYAALNLPMT
ncbi:hypothetical protein DNTS_022780 [Danionella cerebrum]|uniref:Uncharacterized protein n=1 Tax=Danionella cerebrum TaxID=2873325 RepID=A0A553QDF3_9TELE|nr:hypothetical protein DNTS_022780 [Danionella translucida]